MKCMMKVAIAQDALPWSALELGLRQLGFDPQIADPQVNLRTLHMIRYERQTRQTAELQPLRRFRAQQGTQHTAARKGVWVAEDVHQKRVGAGSCIQLGARRIVTRQIPSCRGVQLAKAAVPFRSFADAPVGSRMEIAVACIFAFAEDDGRPITDRAFMQQTIGAGPRERAMAELVTESRSIGAHPACAPTAAIGGSLCDMFAA